MRLPAVAVLASCALAGCGEDDQVNVTFSPASVGVTVPRDQAGTTHLAAVATIDRPPSDVARVNVTFPVNDLDAASVTVVPGRDGYEIDVRLRADLANGRHEGAISLTLCKDADCAHPYSVSGGSLPYDLGVIDPLPVVTLEPRVPPLEPYPIHGGGGVTIIRGSPGGETRYPITGP